MLLLQQACTPGAALAWGDSHRQKGKALRTDNVDDFVSSAMAVVGPMATNLGFSGVCGAVCAVAVKVRRAQ